MNYWKRKPKCHPCMVTCIFLLLYQKPHHKICSCSRAGPHPCEGTSCVHAKRVKLWRQVAKEKQMKGVFPLALLVWKQKERGRRFFLILALISLVQHSWSTHAHGSSSQMPCQALCQYKHQVCPQYMQGEKIVLAHSRLEYVCREREEMRRALIVVAE